MVYCKLFKNKTIQQGDLNINYDMINVARG